MPEMYEFHVTGLIGPVIRAALSELTTQPESKHSVLTGTVDETRDVVTLLNKLTDHGLVADHIVIARDTRWQDTYPTTDGQLPSAGNYSAPRQS